MPKFFINTDMIHEDIITIIGDDAHHISRSLRMAAGEHIIACDGNGCEYDCILTEFNPSNVVCRIESVKKNKSESPIKIHLYQGFPKGDKLDTVIQKSVECGVYDITPFESEYCIAKCKKDSEDDRNIRRNKIAVEAAKQSGRGIIPTVNKTVTFAKMIEAASKSELAVICYENQTGNTLKDTLKKWTAENGRIPADLSLIVGSEGGFSVSEIEQTVKAGIVSVGLGTRILRTETAPVFALSCITYEYEL